MALSDKEKRDVIRRYHRGDRVEDIEAATGVRRSSIYFVLGQAGIKPSRLKGQSRDERQRAVERARRVDAELAAEVVELRKEVRRLAAKLEAAHAATAPD